MVTKFKSTISFFLGLVFFSSMAAAQPKLDLTEGTLYISGSATFQYDMRRFDNPKHDFQLTSDIGSGYFVMDNFSIGLSFPSEWKFYPTISGIAGIKLSTTYFFDLDGAIFPYLGANITPRYSKSEEQPFQLLAGVDAGILISMSSSVALDLGIKPEIQFKLNQSQKWHLRIPTGLIGVRAFF